MRETTPYDPSPMTAEEVGHLHNKLWMALIMLPAHKHTRKHPGDCSECVGRRYVTEAYQMLPRGGG